MIRCRSGQAVSRFPVGAACRRDHRDAVGAGGTGRIEHQVPVAAGAQHFGCGLHGPEVGHGQDVLCRFVVQKAREAAHAAHLHVRHRLDRTHCAVQFLQFKAAVLPGIQHVAFSQNTEHQLLVQAQLGADCADLAGFFQRVHRYDHRLCAEDLFQGRPGDLDQMPYVAEGDLIFHHRQRLAEVHAHSAHISHVGQRTGDQGVASDLLEHEKVLHAVCVACLFDAAGIFQDRVVIQQIGVRQDHAILLPFNAQTHQRLVALHYGL